MRPRWYIISGFWSLSSHITPARSNAAISRLAATKNFPRPPSSVGRITRTTYRVTKTYIAGKRLDFPDRRLAPDEGEAFGERDRFYIYARTRGYRVSDFRTCQRNGPGVTKLTFRRGGNYDKEMISCFMLVEVWFFLFSLFFSHTYVHIYVCVCVYIYRSAYTY